MDPYERLEAINEEITRLKEDVQEGFKEPKRVNYKGGTALPSTMAKGREPVVISTPRGYIVQTYNKKRDIFSQEGPAYKTKAEAEKAAMKLESVQLDEMKKSDGPFTVVATKNNKVVGQIHSIGHHEIEDAIQSMKADNKGAKVSVESKRGRIVHTSESVDEYERLVAISEEISRLKEPHRVQKKKQTKRQTQRQTQSPNETVQAIRKAIDQAANTTEDPKKVEARLKAQYDNLDSGGSPFGRSILNNSFDPSKNPNEKMDKEFDAAQQALTDAGISHTGLPAVGSMTREKNTIKIKKQEDMRRAREVMQGFPNTQIKRA